MLSRADIEAEHRDLLQQHATAKQYFEQAKANLFGLEGALLILQKLLATGPTPIKEETA